MNSEKYQFFPSFMQKVSQFKEMQNVKRGKETPAVY